MNVFLASALVTLATPTAAPVKLTVNAKSGETISGERTFRVTVQSENPITGVEFYVGSDLRDKDTSTPYQFTYDTLLENDGKITLRFRAFTTEGEQGSATLNLNIDNGMSRGAPFHLEAARAFLGESKWDMAANSARVALRVDAKNNEARYLLARAYMGKNQWDKAQKFAEDALDANPEDAKVSELLTAIRLHQAFVTVNRPGAERTETLNNIKSAYMGAIESRRKVVDAAVDAMGAPKDDGIIAFADANLRASRYGAVVTALDPVFRADNRRVDVGNRLAYAQLRTGRTQEAVITLQQLRKYGEPNAFTWAQTAIAAAETGDAAASDEAIREALLAGADDPAVLAAQAFLALKYVRRSVGSNVRLTLNYDDATGLDAAMKAESRRVLQSSLDQLLQNSGNRAEVLTFASALNNRLDEYRKGQEFFERAVLADPLIADAFLEQGNRSLALSLRGTPEADEKTQRYDTAKVHFEAALAARPSSPEALTGLSLVSLFQGKLEDAIRWGESAVRAAPSYAAGHVALGTAYHLAATAARTEADRIRKASNTAGTTNSERQANEEKARDRETWSIRTTAQARDTIRNAATLDRQLEGIEPTTAAAAWRYFYAGGRLPLLPLPR
jgi:tetratricopeptide (TPR) repeat protein